MYHAQTINGSRFAEMRLNDALLGSLILFHDFLIIYWLTFYWQFSHNPFEKLIASTTKGTTNTINPDDYEVDTEEEVETESSAATHKTTTEEYDYDDTPPAPESEEYDDGDRPPVSFKTLFNFEFNRDATTPSLDDTVDTSTVDTSTVETLTDDTSTVEALTDNTSPGDT